jgi:exonuclease III
MVSENMLFWNVRGLHLVAHRNAVHDLVTAERLSLVSLQETKLDVITDFNVI